MTDKLKSKITNPIVVCAVAALCCLLWGSAFPVIKIGYELLDVASEDYMSQILFAGIRFTLAGAFTIMFGSVLSKKFLKVKKSGLYKIPVLALFQTILQYLFFYIGLARTTGTKSSILDSTSVFFSVIIASLILRQEKLTVKKIIGCILGFAGVVIINLSDGGIDTDMTFAGEGFIVISALSYAVSSVMIKRFSKDDSPVALSGYQFVFGGLAMIAVGAVGGGKIYFNSIKAAAVILYLSLLSAVAYTLWGILLKYNPVSRVTVFGFMTPVFGCILSALLLGESLVGNGIKTIIALLLVCAGIFIVNIKIGGEKYES